MSAGKMLHTGTFVRTQTLKNYREHWPGVTKASTLTESSNTQTNIS